MPYRKTALNCLFVLLSASLTRADTVLTASTFLGGYGGTQCSHSDSLSVNCDATEYVGSVLLSATSYAYNTWVYGPGGSLTAFGFGNTLGASGTASIQYESNITVVGASGAGNLLATFTALRTYSGGPNGNPPPDTGVRIGGTGYGQSLFNPQFTFAPKVTTLNFPIAFETALPFRLSFTVQANGVNRFDRFFESSSSYATIAFPTFQVTDASGNPIPGASVVFTPPITPVPEPAAAWTLVTAGAALLLAKTVRRFSSLRVISANPQTRAT